MICTFFSVPFPNLHLNSSHYAIKLKLQITGLPMILQQFGSMLPEELVARGVQFYDSLTTQKNGEKMRYTTKL